MKNVHQFLTYNDRGFRSLKQLLLGYFLNYLHVPQPEHGAVSIHHDYLQR